MSDLTPAPWWALPNIAALDAPAGGGVWQRVLAGRVGAAVPGAAPAALAAAVWAVYLPAGWLDARRGDRTADRHRAAARRPGLFAAGAALAACLGAVAA